MGEREKINSLNLLLERIQNVVTSCKRIDVGHLSFFVPLLIFAFLPPDLSFSLHFSLLVSQNTGHEYQGRATAPDTLMIWTHQLSNMEYRENYLGSPALVLGSGSLAGDAYAFAAKNGHTVTFGAYGSVGVAGGFAQGGGHGPLGPKYGLAVDNILEVSLRTES